jgi:hypothetical protein
MPSSSQLAERACEWRRDGVRENEDRFLRGGGGGAGGGKEDSGRLRSSKERAVRIGPARGEVGVLFTRLPPDGRIFGEPSGR